MATIIQPIRNLPSGTLINGVANFYQSSNPLSRVGGSPLVVGDRNYRTDLRIDTFWNGLYWVSAQRYFISGSRSNFSTTGTVASGIITTHLESATPASFLLENLECYWQSPPPYYQYNTSNYWGITCTLYPTDVDAGAVIPLNNVPLTATANGPNSTNQGSRQLLSINTAYLNNGLTFRQLIYTQINAIRTGTLGSLGLMFTRLNYRLIV